ncbi:related to UPF0617 protein YIL096C [Saccharomycodes ludwigii]|uniref:Related to UPF0617 protein YIL096C n=1 Tax=Saccharomycodes ludwigii TaxID=36035 RepID=A0A376B2V3_9ASCO|nr:hypothetical protein SCDLUD_002749 [Saccharomycodes ludwigii]KAH3901260.1 hypothetical protein SCDLUD_002749 [Saccharomycodes ludwigii]SSD59016.1 related to UPF0617 protein YIL096C [Saccharomycodes ludwigii]
MARKLKGKKNGKGLKHQLLNYQYLEKKTTNNHNSKHINTTGNKSQTKDKNTDKIISTSNLPKKSASLTVKDKFIPFDNEDSTVMLVGEGDFSFAKSLIVNKYIKAENLIVTSYDSGVKELTLKYPNSFQENYCFLTQLNIPIFFQIDVTQLIKSFKLSKRTTWNKIVPSFDDKKIDYIMFNFPHNGKGIKDQERNIYEHQILMSRFFQNCLEFYKLVNTKKQSTCLAGYLTSSLTGPSTSNHNTDIIGKVIVSLFCGEPYDSWQIKLLGKQNGDWKVERSNKFQWDHYPGYKHKRTNSEMTTTKPAQERSARIYIFEQKKKDKNQQ